MSVVSKKHKELVNKTNKIIIDEVIGKKFNSKIKKWKNVSAQTYTIQRFLIHLNAMRAREKVIIDTEEWEAATDVPFNTYNDNRNMMRGANRMYIDLRQISFNRNGNLNSFGTQYSNNMRNFQHQNRFFFDFICIFYNKHFIIFLSDKFVVSERGGHDSFIIPYNDIFNTNRRAYSFYELSNIIVDLYNMKIIGRAGTLDIKNMEDFNRKLNVFY